MTHLHVPFLEALVLIPLLGALGLFRVRDPFVARKWAVVLTGLTLICALGAWQDFGLLHVREADDTWSLLRHFCGRDYLAIDQLSAPLIPLSALLYFFTTLTTLRTKVRRFSFAWTLLSESLLMATLSCREPWGVVILMSLSVLPVYLELVSRGHAGRVFATYMCAFVCLLVLGQTLVDLEPADQPHSAWAVFPLLVALLIRSGIAPFHSWFPHMYQKATFGTALLFTTPMVGAYAVVRLVLPIAPAELLRYMAILSLVTAVYAAGMATVQVRARRFYAFLLLSHSALVFVGLEMMTDMGLTGAFCVWIAVGLSLAAFGLTMRALESRRGRLGLDEFQGLYEHTPALAVCFLLTGLASVGFPGTLGFVGTELLVDAAVEAYPVFGIAVVVATALNGIAMLRAYFRLFTGTRHVSSVWLGIGARERYAVLTLAALILLGGLYPQPGIASRHRAAEEILHARTQLENTGRLARDPHARPRRTAETDHPAVVRQAARPARDHGTERSLMKTHSSPTSDEIIGN